MGMKQPRFLENLKRTNFKVVADQGCYVYAYLRNKDSKHGRAGSPYYVGVSTSKSARRRAERPFAEHVSAIPTDKRYVVCLVTGLTKQEAASAEIALIRHYGRIDFGTGILRNHTAGGDGIKELSPEAKERIRQANLKRARERPESFAKSDDWRRKASAAQLDRSGDVAARYGLTLEEWRSMDRSQRRSVRHKFLQHLKRERGEAISHVERAKKMCAQYEIPHESWAKMTRKEQGRIHARFKLGYKGSELLETERIVNPKGAVSKKVTAARSYGVCPAIWVMLGARERERLNYRYRRGVRGQEALVAAPARRGAA